MAEASFGHKIVDSPLSIFITRKPILDCGILDLCALCSRQLHNSGMQLHQVMVMYLCETQQGRHPAF